MSYPREFATRKGGPSAPAVASGAALEKDPSGTAVQERFGNRAVLDAYTGQGGALADQLCGAALLFGTGIQGEHVPGEGSNAAMQEALSSTVISRRARSSAPPSMSASRLASLSAGSGEPLPGPVRARMEARLGHRLGHVRVFSGGGAATAAQAIGAEAFTMGTNIYFGEGAYRPDSADGESLLVHELTHVRQADEGRLPSGGSSGLRISSPGDAHELEAERAAAAPEVAPSAPTETSAPTAGTVISRSLDEDSIPAPDAYPSFEAWIAAFPSGLSWLERLTLWWGGALDVDATSALPDGIESDVRGDGHFRPDCADVSVILRHHWLAAHQQSFSFKAGKSTLTIGQDAGMDGQQMDILTLVQYLGSINFQETRSSFELVEFFGGAQPEQNLKRLIDEDGLGPGHVLVWKKLDTIADPNFQGHVQTVQKVDQDAQRLYVLQGNMSGGVGIGALQQRIYTFAELTGRDDGDANILPRTEESFFGAGPWKSGSTGEQS